MTLILAYAMMMAVSELQACDAHLLLSRVNVGCALLLALLWGSRQLAQRLAQRLAQLHEERRRRAMLQQAWQGMLAAVTPLLEGAPGAALAAQRG
jgi:hypothetical protein